MVTEFKNKTIFIISYENWGKMLMSKHHYAVQLGKLGNKVYFINHPDKRYELRRGQVQITPTQYENVSVVQHRMIHPFFFKHKYKRIYNFFTGFHINKIIKKVGLQPDIVWSFDAGNNIPLKYFRKSAIRIFMPVDGPFNHEDEISASDKADIIISVTPEILSTFKHLKTPQFQINHGVADVFVKERKEQIQNSLIRIGYSGSLVRNDLDMNTFLKIINDHPDKQFEFWGENDFRKSNIHLPQDVSEQTLSFLNKLRSLPNVKLHGPVSSEELADGIQEMDVLLICYNIKNDQNHHKVLEYLGTGKVIVSNYLSAYAKNNQQLIEMAENKENNDELPNMFSNVVSNLAIYNSKEKQERRVAFAKEYTYSNNVKKIEGFINQALQVK